MHCFCFKEWKKVRGGDGDGDGDNVKLMVLVEVGLMELMRGEGKRESVIINKKIKKNS